MSVEFKSVQLGDAPYPVKQVSPCRPYAAHPVHHDWVRVELQVRLIRGVRHG